MAATDLSTIDTALSTSGLTVSPLTSDSQTPHSLTKVYIKGPDESDELWELEGKIKHLKELLNLKNELDDMSKTLTEYKGLLRLSYGDERTVADLDQTPSWQTNHYESEVLVRCPGNINLDVNVQITGKVPKSTFAFNFSAAKCSILSDLRAQLVSVSSENAKLQKTTHWKGSNLL